MNGLQSLLPLSLILIALVSLASCAAPVQNGGVVMSPHAEARLEVMCRYRASDTPHVCAEPAEE
jgi:hypothetical protein